ncbi:DUF7738 domain-containing protein [Hafnia alvei]|uniref:DUF7738 domain-containing protein n=1 Tax=Hafnia alvei ATCC 51873 TaxID=1002364 RepID=G9YCR5_HAFAL|nr:hypothetical protein [Hafnia alvei]EHM38273.1 hypothetical protein HMPREF0454_04393 [Hafnia alvei ATCC 51873]QQE41698.1 hypothetical protein I6H95_11715 [Hafnia alvei]
MRFELIPFVGLDSLPFGMLRQDVYSVLGEPNRIIKKHRNKLAQEVWYQVGIHLFFDGDFLDEINIFSSIGMSDEKNESSFVFSQYDIFCMPPHYIYSELCQLDGAPKKTVGITILLNLGMGLYGFDNHVLNGQDNRSFALYRKESMDDIIG